MNNETLMMIYVQKRRAGSADSSHHLFIDIPTIAYLDDLYQKNGIIHRINDSVISDP